MSSPVTYRGPIRARQIQHYLTALYQRDGRRDVAELVAPYVANVAGVAR